MTSNNITKLCPKCNQIKNQSDFNKNRSRFDGLAQECKDCRKISNAKTTKSRIKRGLFERKRLPITKKERKTLPLFQMKYRMLYQSAKKRGIEFRLKVPDIRKIYSTIDEPCPYCKQPIEKASVDRKDNSIGYLPDNCILVCLHCNILKGKTNKMQLKQIYLTVFGNIKPSDIDV